MFYVYVLKSKTNDSLYIGLTKDLRRRFKEHNDGKSFTTKKYVPWKLIYYEAYELENLARMREKKLKQHGNAVRELKIRIGEKNYKALPSTGLRGAGFTLVELMIVVGIIGFLALIAISYFRGQLFKGNDARRKSDINRIQVALEEYEKDHNCYPFSYAVQCDPGTGLKPYLEKIPCDPVTKVSYYYEYEDDACPSWYRVYTSLDNKSDANITENIGPSEMYNFYKDSPNAPLIEVAGASGSGPPGGVTFYGCKAGVCQPLMWDSTRPGPECDPNYTIDGCLGQCGSESSMCIPWN